MRCKKHPCDHSSTVGVCATCLRERLFALIAAQSRRHAEQDRWKSEHPVPPHNHAPPPFPQSVSPYITRRKSDTAAACRRFYSTPQVAPSGSINKEKNKSKNKFSSLFSAIFRSKSEKTRSVSGPISEPGPVPTRIVNSRDSCTASPSWYSIVGRRKQQVRTFSVDESRIGTGRRRICRDRDRGMSPAMYSDEDDENCSSGYSTESSKQTPRRTPAMRRRSRSGQNKNVSGLAFCLSPLVRASPSRHWNQKGVPPEMAGEIRVPPKQHLSTAASFCKNRSRKLADFGRYSHNH